MPKKNESGLDPNWTDPDDAPELTEDFFADAEVFQGDKFVRRGRGRPPTGNAREIVSFRLDRDLLAKLREAGPGWQSRVNRLLREAVGMLHAEQVADAIVPVGNLPSTGEPAVLAKRTQKTPRTPTPPKDPGRATRTVNPTSRRHRPTSSP